ncbi:MAG: transketolase [Candidatus Omnitrophica bacterium]|nr:transketolase [Candidatus Omnitrophota bacterium]MBU4589681.1 transketolase [Candidatus Omnitrophota bacterium]
MTKRPDVKKLERIASEIRIETVKMLTCAGSGHTGGSLSMVELLVGLYFYKFRCDPEKPLCDTRDMFILSKGHACPALYATLAHMNFFDRKELSTLRKLGTRLQGHPQKGLPGIEVSSGSLGQGLSIANGCALGARLNKDPKRVYCIMGDGELDEGQIWEAMLTSAHYKLDNLCGIVDNNKFQIDGRIEDVKGLEPLKDKWRSFNWGVLEIDGHNIEEVMDAYDEAETIKGKPTVIIAHTVKGKGVSFFENQNKYHGVAPSKEELDRAIKELEI